MREHIEKGLEDEERKEAEAKKRKKEVFELNAHLEFRLTPPAS